MSEEEKAARKAEELAVKEHKGSRLMTSDEEDEWEEKIKASLRYSVRILTKHPNIDPATITQMLQLQPNVFHVAGTSRKTSKGDPLPGEYRESGWSHWFRVQRSRRFFEEVTKLADLLEPRKEFLHEIVSQGGTIDLIVHLPGDINIGSTLDWRDMVRLAALHIDLGVEVFPDFK
jgi:hypothetical protein